MQTSSANGSLPSEQSIQVVASVDEQSGKRIALAGGELDHQFRGVLGRYVISVLEYFLQRSHRRRRHQLLRHSGPHGTRLYRKHADAVILRILGHTSARRVTAVLLVM